MSTRRDIQEALRVQRSMRSSALRECGNDYNDDPMTTVVDMGGPSTGDPSFDQPMGSGDGMGYSDAPSPDLATNPAPAMDEPFDGDATGFSTEPTIDPPADPPMGEDGGSDLTAAVIMGLMDEMKEWGSKATAYAKEGKENIAVVSGRMTVDDYVRESIAKDMQDEVTSRIPKGDKLLTAVLDAALSSIDWPMVADEVFSSESYEDPEFDDAASVPQEDDEDSVEPDGDEGGDFSTDDDTGHEEPDGDEAEDETEEEEDEDFSSDED